MKKVILLIITMSFALTLTSCDYTKHPNMIEYDFDEVLEIAEDKYNIKSWIFTNYELHGKYEDGQLDTYIGFNLVNPLNTESSFTSFAGKNGNHDIQGMYTYFICYYALGVDEENNHKFVFYNINLDKDAVIKDTIGISDYVYDVLPEEVTGKTPENLFSSVKYASLYQELKKQFSLLSMRSLNFSNDRLSICFYDGYVNGKNGRSFIEFYKENGEIVFDYFYKKSNNEDYKLKYSSSDRYDVSYMNYGIDYSEFIDLTYTVETSKESSAYDLIKGSATLNEDNINGEVIYSYIKTKIIYISLFNGTLVETYHSDYGEVECKFGLLVDKISGVDHNETTTVTVSDFYILYLKNEIE